MRILGIDYGDARIGLALSDASATLCGRAWTLTEWNLERASGFSCIFVCSPLNS